MNLEYRTRMYHLLELYSRPYNPLEPVICLDEKSKQLIEEVRSPLEVKPGTCRRQDSEYRRNGTRNLFVAIEPLAGYRVVEITQHRKKEDFVHFIQELVKIHYPHANKIHIVVDNLNTHFKKSFKDLLPKTEVEELFSRIIFHYTPKHGSWLNMAELEIGILDRQCIKGRIPTEEKLRTRVDTWVRERNAKEAKINWTFTKEAADEKLRKHYV